MRNNRLAACLERIIIASWKVLANGRGMVPVQLGGVPLLLPFLFNQEVNLLIPKMNIQSFTLTSTLIFWASSN